MNKRKPYIIVILTLIALFILGEVYANNIENFVGATDIRNDKRVKSYGGYLLETPAPNFKIRYSASIILTQNNDNYFLLKENISDNPLKPIWKVVIQLKAPAIKHKDYFYTGGGCYRNGTPDLKIIALVLYEENKRILDRVEKAWLVNTESLIIEPISAVDIVCENESYGI